MDVVIAYRCHLALGLHARPASHLLAVCAPFLANIHWKNLRNGREADVRSPLAVLGTDTLFDDPCEIRIKGADAGAAGARIERFLSLELTDDALPLADGAAALPPFLDPGCWVRGGRPTIPGLALGQLVVLEETMPLAVAPEPADQRRQRLRAALVGVRRTLSAERRASTGLARDILAVQADLLDDATVAEALDRAVDREDSLAAALTAAERQLGGALAASGSPHLGDRAQDIADLCHLLRDAAYPGGPSAAAPASGPTILAARRLSPRSVLALDRTAVQGLLLDEGGSASHAVVLARALGLATLTGVDGQALAAHAGQTVMLDGHNGFVLGGPQEAVHRRFRRDAALLEEHDRRCSATRQTYLRRDGRPLGLSAAIVSVEQGVAALAAGADAIGLFRTEMLFLGRAQAPDEAWQADLYRRLVRAANGRTVTFRTADLGGDKTPAYLAATGSASPRGIAVYRTHEALFRTQVRALLQAANDGPIRLLIPMVAEVADIVWVRRVIESEAHSLTRGPLPPIGVMLESTAAARRIAGLAPLADFFHVGANDLAQDLLGVDRDGGRLAATLCHPNPDLLRLLARMIGAARQCRRPIGLCGELTAQRCLLPLLAGLGFDEMSVDSGLLDQARAALGRLDPGRCQALADQALDCADANTVTVLLAQTPVDRPRPIIDADCIALGCDWQTPEEVVSGLVGRLWLAGRIDGRTAMERTLWDREQQSATGVGFGIAIPHARSSLVRHATIAVAKLKAPIPWPSIDGRPVDTVIMLAMGVHGGGQDQLRLFSRLSRRLVTDDFRGRLAACTDGPTVLALMDEALADDD